jgi:hypothetical protein
MESITGNAEVVQYYHFGNEKVSGLVILMGNLETTI